jgi:rod shape-determining protein MreD
MGTVRGNLLLVAVLLAVIVAQTTVFGRVTIDGVAPDVVMLTVIMLALRLRPEATLLVGFTTGLVFDTLGSSALGLRAFTLTAVAFVAVRTRDRADFSPLAAAIWAGLLTLVGVVLYVTVGTLVSQVALDGSEALRRVLLVPLLTFLVAMLAWPIFAYLIEPVRRTL